MSAGPQALLSVTMGCGNSKKQAAQPEDVNTEEKDKQQEEGARLLGAEGANPTKTEAAKEETPKLSVPLKVTFINARGLRSADWVGKSDPYCMCEIPGKPDARIKCDATTDPLNPEWNATVDLKDFCTGESLTFVVADTDVIKADDGLGSVALNPEQFLENGFEGELQLTGCGDGVEAFLTVKVEVIHPKVTVTVVSAKGLRDADFIGTSDPYCLCEVDGRADTQFQTAACKESTNPVWDHEAVVSNYKAGDALQFTIRDSDPAKPDDMLGKLTISAEQFHNGGFEGTLPLTDTGAKEEATLSVKVQIGEKLEEPMTESAPAEAPPAEASPSPATDEAEQKPEEMPAEDVPVVEDTAVTSSCC